MGNRAVGRSWAAIAALVLAACETVAVAPAPVRTREASPKPTDGERTGSIAGTEPPPTDGAAAPVPPPSPEATDLPVALAAGFYETCTVLTSGRVGCWGRPSALEVARAPGFTFVPGVDGATDVVAGRDFACAARRGGVRCWGRFPGSYGQRGRARPIRTLGSSAVVDIAAGLEHVCSVHEDGRARCFGGWAYGYIPGARGYVDDVEGAVGIAAGELHACALLRNGHVRCWGDNGSGQMGDGLNRRLAHPRDVPAIEGARAVASHFLARLTCALLAGDEVRCWGAYGAGRELVPFSATPVKLPPAGTPLAEIAVSPFEVCAIREDGGVICWTRSLSSARGVPDAELYGTPRTVEGATDIVELAMGVMHACARRRDGRILCWGMNTFGQLGDGTTTDRQRPVAAVHVPAVPGASDG